MRSDDDSFEFNPVPFGAGKFGPHVCLAIPGVSDYQSDGFLSHFPVKSLQISSLLFRRVNLSYILGILVLRRPWYLQSQAVTEHGSLRASPLFLHGAARSPPSCLHVSPSFLLFGKSLIFLWGLTVYDRLF